MKQIKYFLALILGLFLILGIYQTAFATQIKTGQGTLSIGSSEYINDEVIFTGSDVQIRGTINGDLLVLAGTLNVSGQVNGNILALVGTVNIDGTVTGSLRAIAGTINISGNVKKNILASAGTLNLSEKARVGESIIGAFGNVLIGGQVADDVRIAASTVKIAAKITGSAIIRSSDISLMSTAQITGDLVQYGKAPAAIEQGAKISGQKRFNLIQRITPRPGFTLQLLSILSYFILAIVIVLAAPRFSQRVTDKISGKFWLSLGLGAVFLFFFPFLIIILALAVITAPLAVIAGILYGLAIYLAKIFTAIILGRLVLNMVEKGAISNLWAVLLGLVIILGLSKLPFIGGLVNLIIILIGLGALILTKKDFYKDLRSRKLI